MASATIKRDLPTRTIRSGALSKVTERSRASVTVKPAVGASVGAAVGSAVSVAGAVVGSIGATGVCWVQALMASMAISKATIRILLLFMKFSLRVSYNSIFDYSIIEYANHITTDHKKQLVSSRTECEKGKKAYHIWLSILRKILKYGINSSIIITCRR